MKAFNSIHLRHLVIHQNDIVPVLCCHFKCFHSAFSRINHGPGITQKLLYHDQVHARVIHCKNLKRRSIQNVPLLVPRSVLSFGLLFGLLVDLLFCLLLSLSFGLLFGHLFGHLFGLLLGLSFGLLILLCFVPCFTLCFVLIFGFWLLPMNVLLRSALPRIIFS